MSFASFSVCFGTAVSYGQSSGANERAEAMADAARKGDAAAVKKFLDDGVEVNAKFRCGVSDTLNDVRGAAKNPGGGVTSGSRLRLSIVLILRRYGLLALVVGLVVQNVLLVFPLTSHLSRWYAPVGLAGIFVIAAVGVYGFYTSLGANRSSQRPRSIIRPRRPLSVLSLSGNPFPARVSGRQVASPIPPGSTVSCSQPAAPSP